MAESRTHYEILGVSPGATQDAIRKAYRALARSHHPDVSGETGAAERFGRIAEAYEVLSDAVRRRAYDLALRSPAQARAGQPSGTGGVAHYTWTNVGADSYRRPGPADRSELDSMYDAFFGSEGQDPHAPG